LAFAKGRGGEKGWEEDKSRMIKKRERENRIVKMRCWKCEGLRGEFFIEKGLLFCFGGKSH
jgi:hypothetical protein